MTTVAGPDGKIVTFYSFKGGVGRTMALANAAFLAAMNGKRVLVMDWDLEAPGLAYYFRGLLDAGVARALRDAPGILNLVWSWHCQATAGGVESKAAAEFVERIQSGVEFDQYVSDFDIDRRLPSTACLHYIGAGGMNVATPEPTSYEDALAKFSWARFIEDEAGGVVLESLQRWGRSNYELVFIDSRTGLADVAGICTMQLPDMVALCFILNRQNIEGVSRVARAVRARRGEAISLRCAPMRVAREGTAEENDARARAIRDLSAATGVSSDFLPEEFRALQVNAADGVPFYESLAPFVATDPSLDPSTLNYLRLVNGLLGTSFGIPQVDNEWVEIVRRRLQPRHATVDYIQKLALAEPTRRLNELTTLMDGAMQALVDGTAPDRAYVIALVKAVLLIDVDAEEYGADWVGLHLLAIDLQRELHAQYPYDPDVQWALAEALELHIDGGYYTGDEEEELVLMEELDGLLSELSAPEARLARIRNRVRAAATHFELDDREATLTVVGEIRALVTDFLKQPQAFCTSQQRMVALGAEIESYRLSGDIYAKQENHVRARLDHEKGRYLLRQLPAVSALPEGERLEFQLCAHLAVNPTLSADQAAQLAIDAYSVGGDGFAVVSFEFVRLSEVVLAAPAHRHIVRRFCEAVFDSDKRDQRLPFQFFFGRSAALAAKFLEMVLQLGKRLASEEPRTTIQPTFERIFERVDLVVRTLMRRRMTINEKRLDEIGFVIADLVKLADYLAIETTVSQFWLEAARKPTSRTPHNRNEN